MAENFEKCLACAQSHGKDLEFSMAFQPIYDIEAKEIFAHEALVRGLHNEPAGAIFQKITEEQKYWFDQNCRIKAIELAARLEMKSLLSINFLPGAVYNPKTCLNATLEASERYQFDTDQVIFEITEVEKVDTEHLKSIVQEYKSKGFKTAIDDFGSGFAGLNLLSEFQPDFIKIDMQLVRNIHNNDTKKKIVESTCSLATNLGIKIIAEGIESNEEKDTLKEIGIKYMQGYYFAKPAFEQLGQPLD